MNWYEFIESSFTFQKRISRWCAHVHTCKDSFHLHQLHLNAEIPQPVAHHSASDWDFVHQPLFVDTSVGQQLCDGKSDNSMRFNACCKPLNQVLPLAIRRYSRKCYSGKGTFCFAWATLPDFEWSCAWLSSWTGWKGFTYPPLMQA